MRNYVPYGYRSRVPLIHTARARATDQTPHCRRTITPHSTRNEAGTAGSVADQAAARYSGTIRNIVPVNCAALRKPAGGDAVLTGEARDYATDAEQAGRPWRLSADLTGVDAFGAA
jgi:hypothetical protein